MNLLELTDVGEGRLDVAWRHAGQTSRSAPVPFTDALTAEDHESLRWYLEEYLTFPYGAEESRAQAVQEKMRTWGTALFEQIFVAPQGSPSPRDYYTLAVQHGLEQCELSVSSDDTAVLSIPWELLHDPAAGGGFLAASLGGLYRKRANIAIRGGATERGDGPFRILLVIARPYGDRDIALGTVARPVLEALRPLRPHVEVDVLRPPTFSALEARLTSEQGRYQLVHFDGHGAFVKPSGSGQILSLGSGKTGLLVFETAKHKPDKVESDRLGDLLNTAHVPLFVLNACQSAQEAAGAAAFRRSESANR